jgi:thiamine pyrophosphokinase
MQRIIIFANGELPDLEKARLLLQPDDYIICADGGTRHALALGLTPHLVIGDMDSINKGEWQDFEKSGVSVELFPQDKNETDLELAIHRALELDAEEVIIIGALGGRLDQTLGNIALLATPPGNSRNIRIDDGVEEIFFCRNQAQVHGRNGDIVSLIPWGNPVHGIQTEGLKWTLHSESLYPEKTRGISNEMIREVANIKISSGVLLIVHTRRLSIRNRKS